MIIKKPYAFLIKRFRLIHFLIFCSILYGIIQTYPILKTFKQLAATGSMQFIGKTNSFVYLIFLIIIVFSGSVLFLLRNKKKPHTFYLVITLYYIAVLIGVLIANNSINALSLRAVIDIQTSRAYNDIYRILLYPQYLFLVFTLMRSTGFDIKKFNFRQDLAELEISEADSEEFEFVVGIDYREYLVKVRRYLRELRYYFLENTTILITLFIGIIGVIIFFIFFGKEITGKVYKERQIFSTGGIQYIVNKSYVTNMDKNGDKIINDNYYTVIDITFKNLTGKKLAVNTSNMFIQNGTLSFSPERSDSGEFIDLGLKYRQEEILPGNSMNRLLTFKMSEYASDEDIIFKIYDGTYYSKKTKTTEIKYIDVTLKPIRNTNSQIMLERFLGTKVSLKNSTLQDSYFNVTSYETKTNFTYQYEECITEDDCRNRTGLVLPELGSANKKLLILGYELSIDKNSLYTNNIKESELNFFKDFIRIRYTLNSREQIIKPVIKNPDNYNEKAILEIDAIAADADRLDVLITIRNQIYVIRLN